MSMVRIAYPGTVPDTNTEVHVIFATCAVTGTGSSFPDMGWGQGFLAQHGLKRHVVRLSFSRAGSMRWYHSQDRGTTWIPLAAAQTITPTSAGTAESLTIDVLIEGLLDYKMEFTQGATAQDTFTIDQTLDYDRASAA